MLAIQLRRSVRRGQSMVLGSLGVLVVAVMFLLTLNVGQAVYEKIRIQQVADAAAFSTATQEARLFNFFSYANRANIAGLVAATTIHSMMSMAAVIPEIFEATAVTYGLHAAVEFAWTFVCCWPFCFSNCSHIVHAIKNLLVMFEYLDEADELRDAVDDAKDSFKLAITLLDVHMAYVALSEYLSLASMWDGIRSDKIASDFIKKYAPGAKSNEYLAWRNAGFAGLGEDLLGQLGSDMGSLVLNTRGFSDTLVFNDADRAKFAPTMIGNGHRTAVSFIPGFDFFKTFIRSRGLLYPYAFMHPDALMKFIYEDAEDVDGLSLIFLHSGQTRIVKGVDGDIQKDDQGPDGNTIKAHDEGWVMSMGFICIWSMIPMPWTYDSEVASGPEGGKLGDDEDDDLKFYCLGGLMEALGAGGDSGGGAGLGNLASGINCFLNFKASESASNNFGQPLVFTMIESDLSKIRRVNPDGDESQTEKFEGAFEIDTETDQDATVEIEAMGSSARVSLADRSSGRRGVALSKAMVYYHLPRYEDDSAGWNEQPNFYNPYWRAKLHPFKTGVEALKETTLILTVAGKTEYLVPMAAYLGLPEDLLNF